MNYGKKGVRAQQKSLNSTTSKWGKKAMLTFLNLTLIGFISVGIIGACAGFGVFNGIIDTAPVISDATMVVPTGFASFVYDNEGNRIDQLVTTNSNRIPVSKEMIPQDLLDAFVAVEDARFYDHNGIDIKGIIRAAYVGVRDGDFSEGASTITQQLLKNSVFTDWTSESTFMESAKRKIQEQYLALELEKVMDKDDILVNYMNTINLGQNTLGVQAASQRYFNKSVSALNLSECAVIAAITQNPSWHNPITHPDGNAVRRNKVLNDMLDQGFIDQAEFDIAMADDVYSRIQIVDSEVPDDTTNSYFVDALIDEILKDLIAMGLSESEAYTRLYSGGLRIFTTQDPEIQRICDDVFTNEENYPADVRWLLEYKLSVEKANGDQEHHSQEMFIEYFKQFDNDFNAIFSSQEDAYVAIMEYKAAVMTDSDTELGETISMTPQPQVSITVADHTTGHVVAMVGARGPKTASRTLNRAYSAERQPGSTFKVLAVYAPALDSAGLTLADVQLDAPFNYDNGRPVSNWYSTGYRGLNSLRVGIQDSLNIVAVKTLTQITPQLGYDYLLNFGFTTLVERREVGNQVLSDIVQSTALGGITDGVTNMELNAAYGSIANQGTYIKPKLYTKILDKDGNVIIDNTEPNGHQVIKESTAFLLTSAMVDVVTSGTGGSVNFPGMPIAGKTGTTSDNVDVWFAGYTPYYTATTWTGYDNNAHLRSEEQSLSRKLWRAVMVQIHEELPSESFPVPEGIVTHTICSRSGKLPITGICDAKGTLRTEYFAEGTVPTEICNAHIRGNVCQYWLKPASAACPFVIFDIVDINPPEHPSLLSGSGSVADATTNVGEGASTIDVINPDGTVTSTVVPQTNLEFCQHTPEFMLTPEAAGIVEQQRAEMAALAAQNAAAAAAANNPATPDTTVTP
ncbi:MAG: transglycosylase domain-containing protein [Lachnospiraceae bacterium]|jgi:penicillin-binding protein 1A|nr:transglycosylase domain-containing protein [Lachnospiraceae bacterium]